MERRILVLRNLAHFAKHLAGTGEVESAPGPQFAQRRQHVMRTIDVRIHCGETICKAFGNETLRGQVVTLVEVVAADHVKDTGITLEAR